MGLEYPGLDFLPPLSLEFWYVKETTWAFTTSGLRDGPLGRDPHDRLRRIVEREHGGRPAGRWADPCARDDRDDRRPCGPDLGRAREGDRADGSGRGPPSLQGERG